MQGRAVLVTGATDGLGRAVAGESVFMNYFEAEGGPGRVAFASSFPGHIVPYDIAAGRSLVAQRGSFLCRQIALWLGPLLAIVLIAFGEPIFGDRKIALTAAVAVLMAVWWIGEVVPLAVTSLLPMALFLGTFGAVIAEVVDKGLIDWLAERGGRLGRALSAAAAWFDNHVVDGLRYWCCEVWWLLKRLHARTMQTGRIQHYMLIVLIAALVLCVVVLRPMGERLSNIIENILGRGLL